MKITCSHYFNNITIICESETKNVSKPNKYLDETIYANIKYIKKTNGRLRVERKYCVDDWYHLEGQFYKISPFHVEECFSLQNSSLANHPWRYIYPLFTNFLNNAKTNLFTCTTDTTSESLKMVYGLHKCADFTFIAEHHVCDGDADCPDASDEMACDNICTFFKPIDNLDCYTMCTIDVCICNKMYFQCSTGGCISLSKFCDGVLDCQDMSDEVLCFNETNANDEPQFTCMSGKLINIHLVNDTVPDCPVHGDDEAWLSDSVPSIVIVGDSVMIACIPGHPKMFNIHLLCQLEWNTAGHLATCRNGAHLSDCIYHSCPHQYKCAYSYCITVQALCDGRLECPDGSDETDCQKLLCPHLLKCKSKDMCVHKNDVNDGIIHCPDFHDDEITAGIKSCPTECQCVGQAVFCAGYQINNFINRALLVRALVLRLDTKLISNAIQFAEFINLQYLDLSHNDLDNTYTYSFKHHQSLVKLLLPNVSLPVIPQFFFQSLVVTMEVVFRDNDITRIEKYAFSGMASLPKLDLSSQMLSDIEPCSFHGLHSLVLLNVSNNLLTTINQDTFCGLHELQILDLTQNDIINEDPSTFTTLLTLNMLKSSVQGMCCYVDILSCSPSFKDDFASCTNILALRGLQHSVWIIALLSILESLSALVTFQFAKIDHSKKKLIHNLNQKHLALSDIIMGFYFLIVAIFNELYEGQFLQVAHFWKDSLQCKVLSFLSLVSFEMTLYMVFIMSLGRFVALCKPTKAVFIKMKLARVIVITGWVLSIAIAAFPVVILYLNQGGLNNALCVMMLSFEHLSLWYVLIVPIINTAISLCEIILYLSIVHLLRRRQQRLTK